MPSPLCCKCSFLSVMFLFFSSKLIQSWFYLFPSSCYILQSLLHLCVVQPCIFIWQRHLFSTLKNLGIMVNHIFQLNCGKFFWNMCSLISYHFLFFLVFFFLNHFYRPILCTFLFITHLWMWKFFQDQLWVAGWSLQGFSLQLCVNSHCHLWPLFLTSNQGQTRRALHNADFASTHLTKNQHPANLGCGVTWNSLILFRLTFMNV